ncbi:hypothetical protein [Exiguobacterium undae]|uniref:Uncharacterized protein n=1 Tax=Exiguobacterium undae TaxID=169177 RepID=A0ABX2V5Y7_9BACL|nr:hypothetical protein [Exiguobacterium undae]OAN10268.1 hypothetical protein A3783_14845 [Exiguobacterium undae]
MNWKHWMGSTALVCGTWLTLTTLTEAAPYDIKKNDQAIIGFYDLETKQTTPYPSGVSPYAFLRAESADKTLFLFQDDYFDENFQPYYFMNAKTGTSEEVELPENLEYLRVLDQDHLVARAGWDTFHVLERQGNQFVIRDTVKDGRTPSVQWIGPNRFSLIRDGVADWYDVQADGTFAKVQSIDVNKFYPLTGDWILDVSKTAVIRNVETNQTYALPNKRTDQFVRGAYETADGLYMQLTEEDETKDDNRSTSLYYLDKQTGQIKTLVDYSDELAQEVLTDGRAIYRANGQTTLLDFKEYLREPIAIDDRTKADTVFLEKTPLTPDIQLTRIDGTTEPLALQKVTFTGDVDQENGVRIPTSQKRIYNTEYTVAYTTETGVVLKDTTRYQHKRYLTATLDQLKEVKEGLYTYRIDLGQADVPVSVFRKDGTRINGAVSDENGMLTLPLGTTGLLGQPISFTIGGGNVFDKETTVQRTVVGYEVPRVTQSTNTNFKTFTYRLESKTDGGTYTVYYGKKKIATVPAIKKTEVTIPYTDQLAEYRIVRSGSYASKSLSLKDSVMMSSVLHQPLNDEQTTIDGALDWDASYGKLYIDGKYTAYIDRKKTRMFAIPTKPLKAGQIVKLVARKGTQLQVSEQRVVAAGNPTLKSYTTALNSASTAWKVKATKGKTIVVTINKKRYTKIATGKTQTMTFPKQKRGTRVTVHAESIKLRKSKTFTLTVK